MNQLAQLDRPRYSRSELTPTSSKSAGRYRVPVQVPQQAFQAVLQRWLRETRLLSDPDAITGHPSFDELVRIAPRVLPDVEAELRRGPSMLVWVLEDALDLRPYKDADTQGDLVRMTAAWLEWFGRARNGIAG